MRWSRVLGVAVGLVLAFVAVTWWALEAGGVAVVETHTAENTIRSTHVWFADMEGSLWLEAGAPENGWVRDIERDRRLVFRSDERTGHFVAHPTRDPEVHAALRRRLRDRYGLRDRWVGLLVDSSRSFAVRLEPAAP